MKVEIIIIIIIKNNNNNNTNNDDDGDDARADPRRLDCPRADLRNSSTNLPWKWSKLLSEADLQQGSLGRY